MAVLKIDTRLLGITLQAGSQYSIELEPNVVKEVGNNFSPNPAQASSTSTQFTTFALPVSVSSTATSFIGDSRFVTTATITWDRIVALGSGNFYIYDQSGIYKTIPVTSGTIALVNSNSVEVDIFDFPIPEGNYYIGWDDTVVRDIFGINTTDQTSNSILGWTSQSLTTVENDDYNTRIPSRVFENWYDVLDQSPNPSQQYTISLSGTSGTFTSTVGTTVGNTWTYTGSKQQIEAVSQIYFKSSDELFNWDLPVTTRLIRDGVTVATRSNTLVGLPFDLNQDRFTIASNTYTNVFTSSTNITVNATTSSVFNGMDGGVLTFKSQQIKGGPIEPLTVEKIPGSNYFSLKFATRVDLENIRKQPTPGSTSTNVDKIRLISTETTYTPIITSDLTTIRDRNGLQWEWKKPLVPITDTNREDFFIGYDYTGYMVLWIMPVDGQDPTEFNNIIGQSDEGINDGDKVYLYLNGQPVRWSLRGVEYPNVYLKKAATSDETSSFNDARFTIWDGNTGQQLLFRGYPYTSSIGPYWTTTERNTQPRGWDTILDLVRDDPTDSPNSNPLFQPSNVWSVKSERQLTPEVDPVQFADVYYKLYKDPTTQNNYLEVWDESTNQQWTTSTSLAIMPLIFKVWTSLNDATTEIEVVDQPYVDVLETLGTSTFLSNQSTFTIQPDQLGVGNFKVYADWAGKISVPKYNATSSQYLIQGSLPQSPTTMNFTISTSTFYKNDATGTTTKSLMTATIAIIDFRYPTHKPNGVVTLYQGTSTVIGSATLSSNSTATITWNPESIGQLDQGSLQLNAVFNGDYWNTATNAILPFQAFTKRTQILTLTSTSTQFNRPGNAVFTLYSQNSNFNGKIVTWYNDSSSVGTSTFVGTVTSLTLDTMTLNTGSHSVYATFNGDFNYNSTSSNAIQYAVGKSLPTFTLTRSSQNPLFVGTDTFTFNVQPELNGKTITYYDQYSNFTGTSIVVNGQASFTASFSTSTQVDPAWINLNSGPAQGWTHRIVANITGTEVFADRQISLTFFKTPALAYMFNYDRNDGYWGSVSIEGLDRVAAQYRGAPENIFEAYYFSASGALIQTVPINLSTFTKYYIQSSSPTWAKVSISCRYADGIPNYQFPTISLIEIDLNRNVLRNSVGGYNGRVYFPGNDIFGA